MKIEKSSYFTEFLTLLLTDGYLSSNKGTYEIGFYNKSQLLINRFKDLTMKLFGIQPKISNKNKTPRIRFYSKEIGEQILKICKSIRTKSYDGVYLEIKFPIITDKDEIKNILRTAFTTDGSINLILRNERNRIRIEPIVKLSCENPYLRNIFSNMLEKIDIGHTTNKRGVFIRKLESIIKFSKVGFVNGVRIGKDSKRFAGYEKQKLLNVVCSLIKKNKLYFLFSKQQTESTLQQLLTR